MRREAILLSIFLISSQPIAISAPTSTKPALDMGSLAYFSDMQVKIAKASAALELKKIDAQIAKLSKSKKPSQQNIEIKSSKLSLVSLLGTDDGYRAVVLLNEQRLGVQKGDILGHWRIINIDAAGVVLVWRQGLPHLKNKKFLLTMGGISVLEEGK